jgi:hypothetical protein
MSMTKQDLEAQKKILVDDINELDDKIFGLQREKVALENQLNKVNHSLSRMVQVTKKSEYTDYRIEDDKFSYHVRRKNTKSGEVIGAGIYNKGGRDAHYPLKLFGGSSTRRPQQSLISVVLDMPEDIRKALDLTINVG